MTREIDAFDVVTIQDLERITEKIKEVPKMDYYNNPLQLGDKDKRLLDALKPIVVYLMYDEVCRLNYKIRNHHHITLSVESGMQYRENGLTAIPNHTAETSYNPVKK